MSRAEEILAISIASIGFILFIIVSPIYLLLCSIMALLAKEEG